MGLLQAYFPLALVLSLLGNILSALVYVAPVPTMYRIYRNKTTEQFQSTPYIVALMNALLWSYYSILVAAYPLLLINVIGAVLRIGYILIFVWYADQNGKMRTWMMCLLLDVGVVVLVLVPTIFFTEGSERILLVGWLCVGSAVSAFAAPLTIIRHVIRTRSAEFLPLLPSLFLTLSAATWSAYGFLLPDIHITVASVLGLALGLIQILLYMIFGSQTRTEENEGPAIELEA